MTSTFRAKHIASEQSLISTSAVRRTIDFANMVMSPEKSFSMIGVVTSDPGTGKTVPIQMLQDALAQQSAAPHIIALTVPPHATQRALVTSIE